MHDEFGQLARAPDGMYRPAGGDERLWVKFSRKSRRNAFQSEQQGRPIYEPVDYISIQQPGERDQLVRPANESDKQRFPRQWEAYQKDAAQSSPGTPVQILFPNEPHIVELLLDLKIQTIDQLAQLSEAAIDRLGMDGRNYVRKAKAAMDKSESIKEVTRIQHELTETQSELAALRAANEQLAKRLEAVEAEQQDYRPGMSPPKRKPRNDPSTGQFTWEPPPERTQVVE